MAVQVRLDLSNSVTIRDLRTFLNCMPHYVDETMDLRYRYVQEERLVYLAVEFPSASRQIEAAPTSRAA
ncbi:hypothetical protein KNN17_03645 [Arthrobacter bambusae]|uniref:hypothetical protein n=1 Tax=Arthrobacter bambusae TaxID=1338426 RepID=UPI001F50A451|nr:hypothetical protein [Arthrobacter bambusae]MCI0140666.1 hypothetical protein [Arthrobacter bambusae]